MTLLAARAFGADEVAITDVKAEKLDLADQLGASESLECSPTDSPTVVARHLKAALPPYGPDIVIDCAGYESTMQVGPNREICLNLHTRFLVAGLNPAGYFPRRI